MKVLVSTGAVATVMFGAMAGAAVAADYNMACAKPGDERTIELVTPGQVGQSCDVRYTKAAGAEISVPYHADNSDAFCLAKAAEIVANLETAGYACAPIVTPVVAEAPQAVTQATAQVAQAPASAQPIQQTVAQLEPAPVAAADIDSVLIEQPVDEPVIAEAPGNQDAALEEQMNRILGEETVAAVEEERAVRGPSSLTRETLEPVEQAPSSVSVGRIVGAAPDENARPLQSATPVTQAALQEPAVRPEAPAAEPQPAPSAPKDVAPSEPAVSEPAATEPAPQPVKPAEAPTQARTPREIILATLNAQVAAWNEGNLDAFMETYWKDDKLKFVSGSTVTQGWSATQKKYRERYGGNGADLGRLSLDKTDFVQVTDDVAIVTGRFNLVKDDAASNGTFSLVMKRVDGMWRIAHDHTNPDVKPAE